MNSLHFISKSQKGIDIRLHTTGLLCCKFEDVCKVLESGACLHSNLFTFKFEALNPERFIRPIKCNLEQRLPSF